MSKGISIKGTSFWVKTMLKEKNAEISLFSSINDAVMSFESMEEAMTQDITIAEFTYNPNPDKKKDEVEWTIIALSWRDIAEARLEAKK